MMSAMDWHILKVEAQPDQLVRFGPVLHVQIAAANEPADWHRANALIDTGATQTCIRRSFADKIGLIAVGNTDFGSAGAKTMNVPEFACTIQFDKLTQVRDLSACAVPRLHGPYDLLIGLDVLGICRLGIDFTTGHWQLHFPIE